MMFAAGFGTRMRPLTNDRPKPMIEVAGKPLIEHALEQLAGHGPVVVNLHYMADTLSAYLQDRDVRTVIETPEILDTGGGLRNALPLLGGGPVVTMNTDAVWKGPWALPGLVSRWEPEHMDALLLCVPTERASGHAGTGDFQLDEDNRLQRGPGMIYTGVQILKTDRLAGIAEPSFSLNRIWDEIHADGRLFGAVYPGQWCDVGTPAGIALAEDMLGFQRV